MTNINRTLEQRGSKYGSMEDNAVITQRLLAACATAPGWHGLEAIHRETVHMIMHKISRMLCGDKNYSDNMHDVAGYATLLEEYQIQIEEGKANNG